MYKYSEEIKSSTKRTELSELLVVINFKKKKIGNPEKILLKRIREGTSPFSENEKD